MTPAIRPMTPANIARVRALEQENMHKVQVPIPVHQVLHAGVYTRHIMIPAGTVITGALIKVSTMLTIMGDVALTLGDEVIELSGVHVIPASAGRKQAFAARGATFISMSFATSAATADEAEREFTDEWQMLSRTPHDTTTITGE